MVHLYGGFVGSDESVDDAAKRVLFELTGLNNLYMRQVGAFGNVNRDPGERVVSQSLHITLLSMSMTTIKHYRNNITTSWVNIEELPKLYSDHNIMVKKARGNDESEGINKAYWFQTYCQSCSRSLSCRDCMMQSIGGEQLTSATSARK
jgi:hypothetical protein